MFLKVLRSAGKLGTAQSQLSKGNYESSFQIAEAAKKIGGITEHNEWLYYSVIGKSLYHLDRDAEALEKLYRAEELLAPHLETTNEDEGILNFMLGISWYIRKLEKQTHNKKRNELDGSNEPPIR